MAKSSYRTVVGYQLCGTTCLYSPLRTMKSARSAVRDEYPHSLSYQPTTVRYDDLAIRGTSAEVAISTSKLHARGPMGLREIMTYKWVVRGDGQIRE